MPEVPRTPSGSPEPPRCGAGRAGELRGRKPGPGRGRQPSRDIKWKNLRRKSALQLHFAVAALQKVGGVLAEQPRAAKRASFQADAKDTMNG